MVEPSEGTEKEKSDKESGLVKGSSQRRAEDELLRVKDSLERSEGRLRAIVDSAVDGIITIDEQGLIESFNPAAERLFGYASAEVLGQNIKILMPAPHREQHDGYLSAYLQTEVRKIIGIRREVAGLRKDGTTFPMMLSVSEVRLPEGRLFTGIVHDRTARRQVEEQRDRLFSLSLDLLGIASTDGYFKRVNPAFTQVLGWSEDEILSRPFMDFVHPDDREATLREVEKLAVGHPTLHFENRYQCKNGSWRWLAWKTMPQVDGLLYATGRDVTELKQAEASLRDERSQLEQRVLDRTQQLLLAKEDADRANRAKSDFLSRMSHELRTPLTSIIGFANLLAKSALPPRDQKRVGQVVKAGQHLLYLVNEVLDIARIEADSLHISQEPVNVHIALLEAVELVRPLAQGLEISLGIVPVSQEWYVLADNQRLKQVLLNLISNAVKYNREGGRVTVSCTDSSPTRLRLTVTDTGPGIPPEQIDGLFEPFNRLGAEKTAIEGTGLGLALAKRLTEAMHGALDVTSEIGRGSTFSVELPRGEMPQ